MGVEKVILRSFLSTLAAIFMLLVFMVGMLVAVYPETMMNISYDLGMEKASVWFAERAYKRHEKIDTIAFATTVAIEENMYGKIVSCGELLIADDGFLEYCQQKDDANKEQYGNETINGVLITDILGTYDQYVYAQVSVAQYKTGDAEGARERAVSAVELAEGFPKNNALVCLLLEADYDGNEGLVNALISEMETLYSNTWEEDDKTYYTQVYDAARA